MEILFQETPVRLQVLTRGFWETPSVCQSGSTRTKIWLISPFHHYYQMSITLNSLKKKTLLNYEGSASGRYWTLSNAKNIQSFLPFDPIYHFWKSSANIERDSRQDPDIIFMQKFMTPSARKCTFKNIESDIWGFCGRTQRLRLYCKNCAKKSSKKTLQNGSITLKPSRPLALCGSLHNFETFYWFHNF